MSATLTPKTLGLLGIKPEETAYLEVPSHFPVARRPVVHVPTCRVDMRMTEGHRQLWMSRIEQIISQRAGRKGIVHSVSYARAKYILDHASDAIRGRLLVHDNKPGALAAAVLQFKARRDDCVLVSPSVVTGYDFPGEECRFQIVAKVPFPDTRSKILQARSELDEDYAPYLTMQTLVQAVGRGVRSETDWCECLVVDDHIGWALKKYKALVPSWFLAACKRSVTIPPPLFGEGA